MSFYFYMKAMFDLLLVAGFHLYYPVGIDPWKCSHLTVHASLSCVRLVL
jgi:hypothetical protein